MSKHQKRPFDRLGFGASYRRQRPRLTAGSSCQRIAAFSSLQIFIEPVHSAANRGDLIFALDEAVAFVGIVMCLDLFAVFLEQFDHLLGFFFRHARIVVTLQDQQRRFHVVKIRDRRSGFVHFLVFFGIAEQRPLILLQTRIGMLQHSHPIDDAVQLYPRCPDIGRLDLALMRREIGGSAGGYVDGVDIGVGVAYLVTIGVQSLAVVAPGDQLPLPMAINVMNPP